MKKIFTLVVLALCVQLGFAQEEKVQVKEEKEEINTLFSKENLNVTGGYIAPEIKVSNVNEDMSLFIGGKVGMTFNKKFTLGVGIYGLANTNDFITESSDSVRLGMVYGGLAMEYTILSNKVMHFTVPVVVGAAGIYIYEDNGDYFYNDYNQVENSAAFVFEPGLNIEFNVFKFMRLDLGASYRLVSGSTLVNLEDNDLSGISFNATFKFGFF